MNVLCLYPAVSDGDSARAPRYPWIAIFDLMRLRYGVRATVISASQVGRLTRAIRVILFLLPKPHVLDLALVLRALPSLRQYDFTFTWYGAGVMLGLLKWLLRLERPRLVVLMYRPFRKGGVRRRLLNIIFRAAFRQADKIVCISPRQRGEIAHSLGIPPEKVKFIGMAIDSDFYKPFDVEDEPYLLCPGDKDRDEEMVIQLSRELPYRIVRVTRDRSVAGHIRSLAAGQNTIAIVHNVPFQELRTLYAKARVVILPLKKVDHPAGTTSRLEAMAMGKAVVATQGLSTEGWDGDMTGVILASPGNLAAWRKAVVQIWQDARRRDTLGKMARRWVEEYASIPRCADEFFNQVLGGGSGKRVVGP